MHLDLDPARRAASVRRAVSQRVRREPRLAAHLAQLDRALRTEVELAAAGGAERVSLLAEPVGGRAVTAALTLVVEPLAGTRWRLAGPPGTAPSVAWSPTVQDVLDGLRADHARALESDPRAELEVLRRVDRPAVRRRWVETAASIGGPTRELTRQLLLPWPGRPAVALLTMTSVCEPIWPLLEATFDHCAYSFRWVGG